MFCRESTVGACEKCKCNYTKTISYDSPVRWNEWAIEQNQMTPLQIWWLKNGHLCPECEQPYSEGELSK
jgi:hypothetical protein